MSIDNSLWGDLSDLEVVRTPNAILAEQADLLTATMEGLLVGHVTSSTASKQTFYHELLIIVPALNHYEYTVLSVSHSIDLYPAEISSQFLFVPEECNDQEEFIAALSNILSSSELKHILSRLVSQVR